MQEIDVQALAALGEDAVVLDVREPDEYREAHKPGAVLIPLGELVQRFDEVPQGDPLYVICHSGGRSARAAQWLEQQGVEAVNIAGGTSAWIAAGQPVVTGDQLR
jgi:rhodanese-related sulfurtransferase